MVRIAEELLTLDKQELQTIIDQYDNKKVLAEVLRYIRDRLGSLAESLEEK